MRFNRLSLTVFILIFSFLLNLKSHGALHPEMEKLIPGDLMDSNGNTVSNQNLQGKIIGLYFLQVGVRPVAVSVRYSKNLEIKTSKNLKW